jgi:hypothetical protein
MVLVALQVPFSYTLLSPPPYRRSTIFSFFVAFDSLLVFTWEGIPAHHCDGKATG